MASVVRRIDPNNPYSEGMDVTPSDSADNCLFSNQPCRALYISSPGDLKVILATNVTLTFSNAPVGYHPLQVRRVLFTGTVASGIIALE